MTTELPPPMREPTSTWEDVAPMTSNERALRAALERIAKWFGEFPDTGHTWPDGTPMSYGAAFGSNGERDFMRQIARVVLKQTEFAGKVPRRELSAMERLHNLCDALGEQADESPFTREEWDAVDRQTVRLTNALRGLMEAVRSIEIDKVSWDTHVARPLQNAYRAIKHEDPVSESDIP